MTSKGGSPRSSHLLERISFVLGLVGLAGASGGLLFVHPWARPVCQAVLPFAALSPILAVAAIISGLISRRERKGRVGLWTGCTSLGVFLFFSMQMGDPPCGERFRTDRVSAIGSLRTINTSETIYASTYNQGYSPDLTSLRPTSGGLPTASAADLIDEVLAQGRKSGYIFTYTPGRQDAQGRIEAYTVIARPIKYDPDERESRTSFFTDESGVIRHTDENRAPTAQDPPMPD